VRARTRQAVELDAAREDFTAKAQREKKGRKEKLKEKTEARDRVTALRFFLFCDLSFPFAPLR
jgi:hypothetical protein